MGPGQLRPKIKPSQINAVLLCIGQFRLIFRPPSVQRRWARADEGTTQRGGPMGTRVDDLFLQVRGATGPNNVAQRRRQRPVVRSVVGVCREVYSHVNAIYAQRPSVPCNMGDKGSTASGANTWPSSSVTFNAAKKRFRSNRRAAAAKWPQLHRRRRGCALKRHGEEPINSLANRDCFRACVRAGESTNTTGTPS